MQAKLDPCLRDHVEGGVLEAVRVEGGGEDDGVRLGVGVEVEDPPPRPLAPHRLRRAHRRVAVGRGRVDAEPAPVHAFDDLHREAAHGDLGVVVHVVEDEDHAPRSEAPEVGIALDQGHARPVPGGGDGGRRCRPRPRPRPGRPTRRPRGPGSRAGSRSSTFACSFLHPDYARGSVRDRGLSERAGFTRAHNSRRAPASGPRRAERRPKSARARCPRSGEVRVPGAPAVHGQNTSGGFHLSTRRSTRVTMANAVTAIPAPRMTVA